MRKVTRFRVAAVVGGTAVGVGLAVLGTDVATRLLLDDVAHTTGVELPVGTARAGTLLSDDGCCPAWAPSQRGEERKEGLTYELVTDEHGFRVGSVEQSTGGSGAGSDGAGPSDARCSVLALGDSFTEGYWVAADEAWPAALERELRAGGVDARVWNGGMRGNSIPCERMVALGRWAHLGPDLVVVAHTANDLADLARGSCAPGSPTPTRFEPVAADGLAGRATDLRTAAEGWRAARGTDTRPSATMDCAAAADAYALEVELLAAGVAAWGGQLAVAVVEPFWCPEGGPVPDAAMRRLDERLAAVALVIDATDALRAQGTSLRPLDSHPSPLGHERIAESVFERLRASGMLTACGAQ